MKKIRLIRTVVIEYEPNPKYYAEGITIEDMAKIDASIENVDLLFDTDKELIEDKVVYQIIETDKINFRN